jgi:hypothetical protein
LTQTPPKDESKLDDWYEAWGNKVKTDTKKFQNTPQINNWDEKDGGKPHNADQPLTSEQLKEFINDSLANRKAAYKRVMIGKIDEEAQKRIEVAYGKKVNLKDIDIETTAYTMRLRIKTIILSRKTFFLRLMSSICPRI